MLLGACTVLLSFALQATPPTAPPTGLPITGDEAVRFLREADVIELADFDSKGITKPRKAVLSDGERTLRAVFKTVDVYHQETKLTSGRTVFKLKDSYKHEIAAYKLDRLLGLGIVPPCVERTIGHDTGSLCLWVENAMTEWQRSEEKRLMPPDVGDFNLQLHTIKTFMQLTYDVDYNNVSNILIDGNWRLYKVDSSRAFRPDRGLRREDGLTGFSRSLLDRMRALAKDEVTEALSPWLHTTQIRAVLARRDEILELADRRVAELGEEQVLYP